MVFWVYFLFVGPKTRGYSRKIYTGYTKKLATRLAAHSGLISTKGAKLTQKQQIELVYLEKFASQKHAMSRERQFKRESPYNKKDYKISLIKTFQSKYMESLSPINNAIAEYYQMLKKFPEIFNNLEKTFESIKVD